MPSSTSVLPAPYFYFFWLLEPILTVAGGVSAIYDPISFGGNTLPRNIERATLKMGNTVRGQIVVSELGSCKSCSKLPLSHLFLTCVWVVVRISGFMLLAMISFSLFYLFKKHLEDKPVLQEKLVKGLLIPLAIADVSSYIIYCWHSLMFFCSFSSESFIMNWGCRCADSTVKHRCDTLASTYVSSWESISVDVYPPFHCLDHFRPLHRPVSFPAHQTFHLCRSLTQLKWQSGMAFWNWTCDRQVHARIST